ncbi:hypothetical protein PTTG_09023, partial [Puccinia triticina 1-1 BBBD Race 1]
MPAMPTKKKRIRILGLQKKHGLPVVEGYWDVANARLELENGVGCKTLPYGTMQFASPLGLLEGWRISHQVIESTEDVKVPDLTGFFHAVSYWLHGVQVYYNQVRKQIIGEMDGQLRQRKTGRLPSGKNFSLFAGDDIFTIDEIDTSHLRTIEGKKPDAAIYITTANLSQAVIVVIELGAKQAKWKEYKPFQHTKRHLPTFYLFYNPKLNNFEIMWKPQFHQPPTDPLELINTNSVIKPKRFL